MIIASLNNTQTLNCKNRDAGNQTTSKAEAKTHQSRNRTAKKRNRKIPRTNQMRKQTLQGVPKVHGKQRNGETMQTGEHMQKEEEEKNY